MSRDEREFRRIIENNFGKTPGGWRSEPAQEFGPLGAMDRADELDDFVPPPAPSLRLRLSWLTLGFALIALGLGIGIFAWVVDPLGPAPSIGLVLAVVGLIALLIPALRRRGTPDEHEPKL